MPEPVPNGEPAEDALLRSMRPDLLEQYQVEKQRHREEKQAIEQAMKRARHFLKRLYGPVLERKRQELETEYLERIQGEDDRHARFMEELRETIRDHWMEEPPAKEKASGIE